ncbi:hypothetical protein R3P38DRAFT_2859410 [Favolaschia claudopus]|uniref:Uncharacterized protein n=1 Tax=Favolaschia claudopus TaxID=2862362 RepID=A0AAW0DNZ5_9AGAR
MSAHWQVYKPKRSLQDTPVNLTFMQQARECLKIEFSSVTEADLANVGIERKFLVFNATELERLLTDKRSASEKPISQICVRLSRIYRHVSMRYEPGIRMILDAVLLTVAEICFDGGHKIPVAILPGMQIASGEGILLKNPVTSFEMWFTGAVNYDMCTYEDEEDLRDRVLNADLDRLRRLAKSHIFLIADKRLEDKTLFDFMPEAIAQAASFALAVRFCLTDGRKWIFSVFVKNATNHRVCYEGSISTILEPRFDSEGRDSAWEQSVHRIVELVTHWLVAECDPLTDALYRLRD